MKEPKKWKYPRLYWTDALTQVGLIIIYPDGDCPERTHSNSNLFVDCHFIPCWYKESEHEGNPEKQRQAMMEYAMNNGFVRHFIGEIK